MSIKTIQDILPLIEQPSRYLGTEINSIKKDQRKVRLNFALVFPDLYEIGTSHLGLQILYNILNSHDEIAAERVYAPGLDMERYLRSCNLPIMSLETRRPLHRFDIIGFSLLYELNYTNMLTILDLANVPFFAGQRDFSYPLIIAGGPCTCNPEPVVDFFDAIVIGDGEKVILEISHAWLKWKERDASDKETLLQALSDIDGVYIPAFFEPQFDELGFQTLLPKVSRYTKVTKTIVEELDGTPFPKAPVVPYGKPVHDRLALEISRGCTRGCRFCQAGMIYRPVRERSPETLLALSDACLAATGYEDISLLSLSTGDYGCIVPLMECLMSRFKDKNIAVSFPSLRAGTLTPALMNLIKKVRKTGFTIAPEAGSQRLRDVINKDITKKEIIDTVQDALSLGWQVIKLYFMIGLPFETDDDLKKIADLVKNLRKLKGPQGRKIKINVSVATFIPKPHTPFQWAPQISLDESKEKMYWLKNNLKMSGINFKWQNPEVSVLEGLFARGDRRLSHLLVAAYKKGCKFDGWSDKFQYRLWEEAFSDTGVNIDFYTTRTRNITDPLPWDHIDIKVKKDFLKEEWEKAADGQHTSDCRGGDCNSCGVCDFEVIEPKIYKTGSGKPVSDLVDRSFRADHIRPPLTGEFYKRFQVFYSKQNQAKYFGHLELVNIFLRAIKRAKIPVKFSEGFHPKPRISFEDPLPIGLESLKESFCLKVLDNIKPQTIIKGLNEQLPDGLVVHDCRLAPAKHARKETKSAKYLVIIKDGFFDEKELKSFIESSEYSLTRTNRKGKVKTIDLKETVLTIELLDSVRLQMTLRSEPGKTVRPFEVITNIFSLPEEQVKQAKIVKQDN